MKNLASVLVSLAAGAAFVFPVSFTGPVEGCSDSSYRYATLYTGGRYDDAAATAKLNFCRVVEDYERLYN